MKKVYGIGLTGLFGFMLAVSCVSGGNSTEIVLLDQVVKTASENITQNMGYSALISSTASSAVAAAEKAMQTGNMDIESIRLQAKNNSIKPKIAVLNFSSPSVQFSSYIIEELSKYLIDTKDFMVVERNRELDLILQENKFQMSGDVSDESIVGIGKKLGAQFIVSGSLTSIGKTYRLRIKVLNVETAQILMWPSWDINSAENKVVSLLAGAKPPREGKQKTVPKARNEKIYKIGDKGPGGGIIFFAENGKYMECSRDLGEANWVKALQTARRFKGGSKNDWRLPTQYELNLIYDNLFKNGYGDFREARYWSSSEESDNKKFPLFKDFQDGGMYYNTGFGRALDYRVCAVRNF
jgi:TolB-like protein